MGAVSSDVSISAEDVVEGRELVASTSQVPKETQMAEQASYVAAGRLTLGCVLALGPGKPVLCF